MRSPLFRFPFHLAGWLVFFAASLAAQPVRDRHVEAELVAATTAIVPGEPLTVALRFLHDDHWHTYWKTTATGYASSLDWDLPEGFSAGEIEWTVPQPYDFAGFLEYVYEGEILLPVRLETPATLTPGQTVTLRATAKWLMCEKTCIPGQVDLELTLPVAASAEPSPKWAEAFELAARAKPIPATDYTLTAWRTAEDRSVLQIEGDPDALAGDLYFFDEQVLILPEFEQPREDVAPGLVRLSFPMDPAGVGTADRFVGVLRTSSSWHDAATHPGLIIDTPFLAQPPEGLATGAVTPLAEAPRSLLAILAGAFLGGLILNLMPCVFPVLGIKVMGFVQQAGESRQKVIAHGLTFTAGVLLSFWLLAAVLIFLRSGGAQLGWGFQLQNPIFVFGLAVFLFLFALNMSGLFEIGNSAVGVGSQLTARSGLTGSFFSGVLATVVATPCAAPFLAPALGIALALPAFDSLVVFTAIALGLALPYLLLSAFPALIRALPRPGAWMETFKQAMAFLLYGTVAFLLWVLAGQLVEKSGYAPSALLNVFFGLLLTALAAWIYGRWGAYSRPARVRRTGSVVALVILVGGLWGALPRPLFDPVALAATDAPAVSWEEWAPGKAEALAAEGHLVYVDFTARWCVTCQSNKAIVFSSAEVRRFFREAGVVALVADWTNTDPDISDALESFGRHAVPFNLVYGPDLSRPRALPELLTPGIVLEALRAARAPSAARAED